jgi:hypothetical protein
VPLPLSLGHASEGDQGLDVATAEKANDHSSERIGRGDEYVNGSKHFPNTLEIQEKFE